MKHLFSLCLLVGLLTLVGCAEHLIEEVDHTENMGTRFTTALQQEYNKLARKENEIYNDEIDAHHFAVKARQAAAGYEVGPEFPADWNIPNPQVSQMNKYRERLVFAIQKGEKISPRLAAQAQVAFDCWVEETEEAMQPTEIGNCKALFLEKLRKLEAAGHEMSPVFVIWFNLNSAKLTKKGDEEIMQIVRSARQMPHHKISVRGLTDGIGGRKFNLILSQKRAEAVKEAIVSNGIPSYRISTSVGMGEAQGTRELDAQNRRVEVQLH